MNRSSILISLILLVTILVQCEKDPAISEDPYSGSGSETHPYYLQIPPLFPDYFLDEENCLTYEGIALGRKLFFDPILSKNQDISCASCHPQANAFADPKRRSVGTNGDETPFNSMPLFNIAWMNEFFWNGRAKSREEQALKPVINPIEMDMDWEEVIARLVLDDDYPKLFEAAFGTKVIDSLLVAKALVQYEMTLISANSKFDQYWRGEMELSELEGLGESIFNSEEGDCFHCHGGVLTTDNIFHNTGLDGDADLQPGLAEYTGRESDFGKFKTPSLRNLAFTAPYMHDGRYKTLEQVVNFYSDSVQINRNVDDLMKAADSGGVRMTAIQKKALIAYLLTMTDSAFVTNPAFGEHPSH